MGTQRQHLASQDARKPSSLLHVVPERPARDRRRAWGQQNDGVRVACYCRVSSHEQKEKGDLERQMGRVLSYCVDKKYRVVDRYEEVSSGMADERCKLKQLFRLIEERKIDRVVIEHKDRLCRCRFMFNFLVVYFKSHGVEIEWMEEVLGKTYEQELVEDMLALMSSFSNRIYGKRSAENRKARKLAELTAKMAQKVG